MYEQYTQEHKRQIKKLKIKKINGEVLDHGIFTFELNVKIGEFDLKLGKSDPKLANLRVKK